MEDRLSDGALTLPMVGPHGVADGVRQSNVGIGLTWGINHGVQTSH